MHVACPQPKASPGTWCFPWCLLGKGLLLASRQAADIMEPAPAAVWALQQCLLIPDFFASCAVVLQKLVELLASAKRQAAQ